MSLEVTVDLLLLGVLLPGVSLVLNYLQPDLSRATLFTGVASGAWCVVCGVLGRRGVPCRAITMAILAVSGCAFAVQAVLSTLADRASNGGFVPALMAVLVTFCIGMITNMAREGKASHREQSPDRMREPSPAKADLANLQNSGCA